MKQFKAEVLKSGIMRYIWIPQEVSRTFKKKGHIPVRVKINNFSFRSTLAPRKNNKHILYLNGEVRSKANIKEGEILNVNLEFDPDSRELTIPEDLELIMNENRDVWNKFLSMTSAHRNELIKFLASAKRPETRLKRIERIIDHTIKWKSGETF